MLRIKENFSDFQLPLFTILCSHRFIIYHSSSSHLQLYPHLLSTYLWIQTESVIPHFEKYLTERWKDQTSIFFPLHSNCAGVYLVSDLYVFSSAQPTRFLTLTRLCWLVVAMGTVEQQPIRKENFSALPGGQRLHQLQNSTSSLWKLPSLSLSVSQSCLVLYISPLLCPKIYFLRLS